MRENGQDDNSCTIIHASVSNSITIISHILPELSTFLPFDFSKYQRSGLGGWRTEGSIELGRKCPSFTHSLKVAVSIFPEHNCLWNTTCETWKSASLLFLGDLQFPLHWVICKHYLQENNLNVSGIPSEREKPTVSSKSTFKKLKGQIKARRKRSRARSELWGK